MGTTFYQENPGKCRRKQTTDIERNESTLSKD